MLHLDSSRRVSKDLPGMTVLNTKLNKLKKTNPEAFYYWSMVDRLLKNIPLTNKAQ